MYFISRDTSCATKLTHQFKTFCNSFFYSCVYCPTFVFDLKFTSFFLGIEHRYYWSFLRGSNLWCHPDHSSEPRLQASCGEEQLTSFTHQEKTPSAQRFFSPNPSTGVKKTTTRLGFRTDAPPTTTHTRNVLPTSVLVFSYL